MYRVNVKKSVNTDKFRPAAIEYKKHVKYIAAPKGTTAYFDYWDRELDRCLNGYTAEDGERITGYFYFYLNYCRIVRVTKRGKNKTPVKESDFPDFYDYDRAFFDVVDEAEKLGKHLAVLKARRKGYSYKIAAMMTRNYYLIPESKSYAYAAENEFLIKDGILTKTWDMFDFIDENTAWYKKRQKIDTKMHKRASYVYDREGVKVEFGYKSEVIGVTVKNDVQKVRGKSAKLIIYEEGGKFPNLKEAWQIARPSVEQGDDVVGMMIVFGTGGTEDANFEGLRDIFYEPEGYNCLPIENIWDDGMTDPCGFFVPDYYNFGTYMDDQGNSLVKDALKYAIAERERIIKSASDKNAVDRHIAEHCFTPQEACLEISTNIFPKADLIKHLSYIRTHKKVQDFKQVGDLVLDEHGIVKWQQSPRPKDITRYKYQKGDDMSGDIVIWEHPVDNPGYAQYVAGCDPYDQDQSTTSSLGSIFIYKRFKSFGGIYETVVAEYTGRPKTAEMFYEKARRMLEYYNAKLLYENQNPGLFAYFKQKHCEYLLADQPNIISKIIDKSAVQRIKGIHMTKDIKAYVERVIRDWLNEERGDGLLGLHTLLSEPLLEELIAYNADGNFDRVIAFGLVLLYKEELYDLVIDERKKENKTVELFPNSPFKDYENSNMKRVI